ncbi:hypothetical protein HIM_02049 [Hirsutella minnesotensis 3608]|nr:hypothetical protein HIM_02049 [Hirsutella minnesotensis 3608]
MDTPGVRVGPPGAAEGQDGGRPDARPRKFAIQSTFGNPRERRSRKNRPCDACRRRKTACVITSGPPCLHCQSRGLVCQSSQTLPARRQGLDPLHHSSRHSQPPLLPLGSTEPKPTHAASMNRQPPCKESLAPQPNVSSRLEVNELLTPSTIQDSPKIASPLSSGEPPQGQEAVSRALGHGPAAIVHQNLVYAISSSSGDADRRPSADDGSPLNTLPDARCQTQSLEDITGRTAYHLGPTSEQDTILLDAFRYGILNERFTIDANILQVHPGSSTADDRPIHFLALEIGHPDYVDRARKAASDAIEAQVWPYGENLVRLYFRHIHPVLPILSKVRFLRRYHSDKTSLPACLRGAVYGLACAFWDFDMALRGNPCPFPQHEIVDHAHAALRREIENPNLFVVQACLLLIHVMPPAIDAMEAPTTWTLAAQATACAQTIGLHQDPGKWGIDFLEKKLRRKIWWAIFMTDCWSSICHGNPPHISLTSFDTSPPTMEDVRADEDVPEDLRYLVEPPDIQFEVSAGARFMEMVTIARHLRVVIDCSYQVNTRMMTVSDRMLALDELVAAQAKLRDWPSLLPSCLVIKNAERRRPPLTCYNCPLYLSFYAAQVLLYRALMFPPTRAAKSVPTSNLRRWFPCALVAFESFIEFFACISTQDLIGFWGRHARSQLILCGNFLIYLFLLASERQDIERAYRLLESFHHIIHELGKNESLQAKTLLRAATLRIDSFFTQAAEIMRHGGNGAVASMLNPGS